MAFNTGWTRAEIDALTVREMFKYVEFFLKFDAERMFNFFKAFCIYNAESSAVAFGSDKSRFSKYMSDVRNRKIGFGQDSEKVDDIDEQFNGVRFGK